MVTTRRPERPARGAVALALLAVAASPAAFAQQRSVFDAAVDSRLTWTSNALLGTGAAQTDTVLEVRPSVAVRNDGARLKVAGTGALNGVAYLGNTRPSRVLPQGDLNARLEAIERWLFLEAELRAGQSSADPFGVRPEAGTTSNTLTSTQVRLSPSIEASIDPRTRYRVRSDNGWTHESIADSSGGSAPTGAAGYYGRHAASIERDPQPFGWRLEGERKQTRYRDGVTTPLVSSSARLIVNLALTPELTAGLRGGYQRDSFLTIGNNHTIYGAQAKWQPSVRTLLSVDGEKQPFGSTWRLGFDHRATWLAFNLAFSRAVQTVPERLFDLPATSNVRALLNEILARGIPNDAERARAVEKLIAEQGLPSSTLGPTSINSQRLSLVTARGGSIGLVGARNTLVLSGFNNRSIDLPGASVFATGSAINNNRQYGGGLALSHRLSPFTSLSTSVDWSRIQSVSTLVPVETSQRGIRVQCDVQASPRTNVLFGGRYRTLTSNAAVPGHESSLFFGLAHGF
jgi:uncharacterized protein (PEP-CTERM system associated)